jgi:DMSO/TMAO reductase YedYZ heme-binding membrane subunit
MLAASESVAICLGLPHADLRTFHGTESIVLWSVRCALPLFLLAFTASSLAVLWPGRSTRWLLANRRYVGLAFAFSMAWHFVFVGYFFFEFGRRLNLTVTTLDLIGAAFLAALTLTSFRWSASRLGPGNWRRLHKTGVYIIWLLALYIYASGARYQHDAIHLGGTAIFLTAWLLRVVAALKMRATRQQRTTA